MPKGLKATSSPIQISANATEGGPNTFATEEIQITLNVLDNEVFVITQVNIDVDAPDLISGTTSQVSASLSTTRRTTVGSIAQQNVVASARREIVMAASSTGDGGIAFDREDPLFAALDQDYLGICATNNMFLNIQGLNNGNPKVVQCRVYGFRATADSSTYAALVQSELLSA